MSKLLNFISHYLQIKHYENIATLQPHFLKKKGFKIYHSKNSHLRLILTTPFFLVIVWACDQAVSLDSLYNKQETLSMLRHLFRLATSVSKLETVNSFVPKKDLKILVSFLCLHFLYYNLVKMAEPIVLVKKWEKKNLAPAILSLHLINNTHLYT